MRIGVLGVSSLPHHRRMRSLGSIVGGGKDVDEQGDKEIKGGGRDGAKEGSH